MSIVTVIYRWRLFATSSVNPYAIDCVNSPLLPQLTSRDQGSFEPWLWERVGEIYFKRETGTVLLVQDFQTIGMSTSLWLPRAHIFAVVIRYLRYWKVLRRVKCKLTPCFMSRCNPWRDKLIVVPDCIEFILCHLWISLFFLYWNISVSWSLTQVFCDRTIGRRGVVFWRSD